MEELNELVGGLILVSGFVAITYFIAKYTFMVKKMLVEKGLAKSKSDSQISKRDVAYVALGLGVGLLITAGLSLLNLSENLMDLLGWGIVLISGSIGLLAATRNKRN
ncbi:hypothetical protein [Roseivirga misakiensis]|uniref:DUF3784 domain-containing protein n=1 Tax=Roseivirga misakiensis TaxID=1563681 RepID=A0A1E5SZQ1_9BACT|nr:hypothetical protein [Roseivirga misakiensis]OEK04602.1 hypothetical protein BFP71_14170 [Roseivirga misakiensis]